MVTAILLRMILYAPIIGIGGIYKVAQTGAGMGWIIALAVIVIVGFVLLLVSVAMPIRHPGVRKRKKRGRTL